MTSEQPARTPITYRAVLGSPYVARLLIGTLIGRLPNSMAPVAIVLLITTGRGSLALGSLLGAAYVLTSALSQPAKGLLMARFGQTCVAGPAVLINAAGLLALATPPINEAQHLAVPTALVLLAGLCTPPLEAGLRVLWPTVLPHPERRRAALALDTGSQGTLYIAGPLLVAALASAHGPEAALLATASLGLAGSSVVLTAPPSRNWRLQSRSGAGRSPLRNGDLRLLLLALSGIGFAVGALNVWAVNLAGLHHMELLSGAIPAAFSAGSFLGGLLFGRRAWPGAAPSQLIAGAAGFAISWLPLLLLPGPLGVTALAALPGLFLPVVLTLAFMTAESLTRNGSPTGANAWLILSYGVGSSAGTALAGALAAFPIAGPALPLGGGAAALVILGTAGRRFSTGRQASPSLLTQRQSVEA
ncbi:MFS transporter [Streptomyces erythrochromogenes]|uniref:MFS transporter n=1 Tax=Streptomyces erythrochromogenes TaxID=285574 RepID=UPI0034338190